MKLIVQLVSSKRQPRRNGQSWILVIRYPYCYVCDLNSTGFVIKDYFCNLSSDQWSHFVRLKKAFSKFIIEKKYIYSVAEREKKYRVLFFPSITWINWVGIFWDKKFFLEALCVGSKSIFGCVFVPVKHFLLVWFIYDLIWARTKTLFVIFLSCCSMSLFDTVRNVFKIVKLFIFALPLAFGLKCWNCDSDMDRFCGDRFDYSIITDEDRRNSYYNCPGLRCVKVVYDIGSKCGFVFVSVLMNDDQTWIEKLQLHLLISSCLFDIQLCKEFIAYVQTMIMMQSLFVTICTTNLVAKHVQRMVVSWYFELVLVYLI